MDDAQLHDRFAWSSPTIRLDNGYLFLVVDLARPRITSLRVDPSGRGRYSPNQLATGLRPGPGRSYPDFGALTQYVDAEGLHSSADGGPAAVVDDRGRVALVPTTGQLEPANPYSRLDRVRIGGIRCGAKTETWVLELHPDAPGFSWTIEEHWDSGAELTDCRTPILWFAQRDDWGEPFHFQFLRGDLVESDPYDNAIATLVSGGASGSRRVVPEAGSWIVAPTAARVDADLRVEGSAHVQRAAVLNWWSALGQTRIDPALDRVEVAAGTRAVHRFDLTFVPRAGSALELDAPAEAATSRSLFASHVNCAMVADPVRGLYGNEPDGYHASMVSWMHARALLFATPGTPVAPRAGWTASELMRAQLRHIAASTTDEGVITSGYASRTALDTAPSFALSLADWLVESGDRAEGASLAVAVRRALDRAVEQAEASGGLLSSHPVDRGEHSVEPDHVIDYWDWSRRRGAIAYPNLLLAEALRRQAEVEAWLGSDDAARRTEQADVLASRILERLWDEDAGALAESADEDGRATHLYTAVQYLGILSGVLPAERAARTLATLDAELARPEWAGRVGPPTNLRDATGWMPNFPAPAGEVVAFPHTMNGGSLLSWAYFEIGALVHAGRVQDAWVALRRVLDRYRATALMEGGNYWDALGRLDRARLEPFLGDVGIVATAIPRWFIGVEPRLDGIVVRPNPPEDGVWEIRWRHLGRPARVRATRAGGSVTVDVDVAPGTDVRVVETAP